MDSLGVLTRVTKRTVDVAVAIGTLLVTAPLLGAITAAIWLTIGRPVFFRQERMGLGGKLFTLWKFRTMREAQPGQEELPSDDERLTLLGECLRASSLDEMPSLWNVLRGDMSLVGPRPLLPRYLSRYTTEQARRHEVRPGITGWAQVNGRNAIAWEEKFRLDVWYVDHRSFFLDIRILLLTPLSVIGRRGISAEGAATMPEFKGSESKEEKAN